MPESPSHRRSPSVTASRRARRAATGLVAGTAALTAALALPATAADEPDLADFFGFTGVEVVRIGNGAGPMITADADGDGRTDIIVANDRESRIEIHRQDPSRAPGDEFAGTRVNEFPEHWRFERVVVPVRHAIGSMAVDDFDADGTPDMVYAGNPSEIVFLRGTGDGNYDVERRHRRRGLSMSRAGMVVADVLGDERTEVLAIIRGEIHVHERDGFDLGQARILSAGSPIVAMRTGDFDGDGRTDVVGLLTDDPAPMRLWAGGVENGRRTLGAQERFEMPPLSDARPVRVPGRSADLVATIETLTRRVILHELTTSEITERGDRDAAYTVRSWTGSDASSRVSTVSDLDGDGQLDLLVTDVAANALAVHRQTAGRGLGAGDRHPTLSDVEQVVAGNVDGDAEAEIFVLSGAEELVGRVDVGVDDDGNLQLPFPKPMTLPDRGTPTALAILPANPSAGDPARLVVLQEEKREYTASILSMDGSVDEIELGKLSRAPGSLLATDADQDGHADVLVLTDERDPILIRAGEGGAGGEGGVTWDVLTADDMGQIGLVKAADRINTEHLDVDGDGRAELLVADGNFVRALRYDEDPGAGVSPGWQVVLQINAEDTGARLRSLSIEGGRIIAADAETDALVVMAKQDDGDWNQREVLTVRGFDLGPITAGAFSGDGGVDVLSAGSDGFAIIRFAGTGKALRAVSTWQPGDERRRPHELGIGDVNGDGFVDVIALDAAEQQCDILTIDGKERLRHALGFTVFESRLFSGAGSREYEPSQAIIADVTGDGAGDLVLLAHDRILVYPQMTEADADS